MQADFAAIALTELTETYIAESDLARKEAQLNEGNVKLQGWSRAVDQYASQLLLVLEDIELGLPVELRHRPGQTVVLAVGGRIVILGHPRVGQQAAFEQRVLADFCTRNNCRQLTASGDERRPIPVSASQVKPRWDFTEGGAVCSHNGIEVRFAAAQNLSHLRGICEQFLQEVVTLATELAWQARHGVAIDWAILSVRSTPRRPEHLVQLNAAGDSILVTVPLIYSTPGLLAQLKPWLRDRYSGNKPAPLSLDATRYGW